MEKSSLSTSATVVTITNRRRKPFLVCLLLPLLHLLAPVAASTAVATIAAAASVAAATVVAASVAVIVVAAVPVGVGNHLKVVIISQRLYRSHG